MSSKKQATGTKEGGKPALVPKLRFAEFHNKEGWNADSLGEVADFVNEKIPLVRVSVESYVSTENILPYYGGVARASKLPTTGSVTRYRPNDTLVSNIRPYLKKVWVADKEGGASNDVIVIRAKRRLLPQFLSFLLKNDAFIDYVMTDAKGVKMPRGDVSSMKAYPTPYPSKPEQQKIAECLGSVDEVIAAQARTVDALKTRKKGLMQQLFPREGEAQPRLRFPEFQNAGEWEEKRLEDLAKRGSGHTPSKSYPEYYNGGIKWVSLADSKRLDCGLISDTAIKISEQGIENSSAVLHPAGTVLISRDAGIGKSAVMSLPMAVSQHFIAWTCKPRLLSNWFLYHLLQNSKPLFERAATGSTIKTIGLQFFIDLIFRVPLLSEQQRIADCLNSLDDLITAEAHKFEALKTHKKGLMQQLFPRPEEIES